MEDEVFVFPVSFAQQRLWFLDQLEPGSSLYNLPFAIRIDGALSVEAMQQTLHEIVARHETLRTTFATMDEQAAQVITPTLSVALPVVDLRHWPEDDREAEAHRLVTEESERPFDLARGPLFRTRLLRLRDEEHILILAMHHIISDGWSGGVLFREITALYEAFSAGKPSPLLELPIQYADYAVWQREWLQGDVLEGHLAYWKQQLAGAPAVLELPTDRPRPAVQSFRGARQSVVLSQRLTQALKSLSLRAGSTMFMTLLAAFQTLLFCYIGREDIVVGTDVAGRTLAETESLIGFFVNLLVLRTNFSGNPGFQELLGRVKEAALGAYAHQDVPFEKVVEAVKPKRSLSHTPLFQVMFTLQNAPQEMPQLPGLTLTPLRIGGRTTKFDLTLFINEAEQSLIGTLEYNADLFDDSTITRMASHFETLLQRIAAQPNVHLNELCETLVEAEKKQRIVEKRARAESNLKKFKNIKPKVMYVPRGEATE